MTPQNATEAPHFTKEMLLEAMRHLRADFVASLSGEGADERARARLEAARRLGLDKVAGEAIAAIDQAIEDVLTRAWPGGLDQRYLGLVGTIERLADVSASLMPHDDEHAHLSALAPIIARAQVAAGSGLRRRLAERMRGLYVILDPDHTNGRGIEAIAEQALAGGATALQLHVKPADKGGHVATAARLTELCERNDATLIVTNHVDLAVASGAHGVHLARTDLPISDARKVLKPWQIAGMHTAVAEEALAAFEAGADYVSVTPMFPAESTVFANAEAAGIETLASVCRALAGGPPVIAAGGLKLGNVGELAKAGAAGIAVMGAVTEADDPREAARSLLAAFRKG
jgi:thiamine-phosphate pyrophosphorylase